MKKCYWFLSVLLLVSVASFMGCRSDVKKEENNQIKIGVLQSWILEGPFYVAQEKGFYQEEGVEAEIVEIGSVDEFVPALVAKEIDVAELIADMFIVQAAQESNIRQILRKATLFGVDGIVATDDIKSTADLRGKKIAVQTVSPSHYLLLNVLREAGVKSSEVTLLPTEAGAAGAAFLAGSVDVAVTWEPWLSRASERQDGKILYSTADNPELIYDILIARDDATDQEKKNTQAVLRAWFKALKWMEDNPEETVEIFAKHLELPAEEIEFFFTKLEFMNYEKNLKFYGTEEKLGPVKDYTNDAAQIWLEEDVITEKPEPEKIIDPSYLEGLYSENNS